MAFLCSLFRDVKQPMKRRVEAAKSAAPYMHARLAATLLAAARAPRAAKLLRRRAA
jgi:hypothetical protein